MTPATIKQLTLAVPLSNGITATVRRLAWKAHKDLLRQIPAAIKRHDLLKLRDLNVAQLLEKLPEIIDSADDLIDHLLLNATDIPIDVAQGQLNALDIGELVSAAVRLNFDLELKNSWAGIGSGLTSMFLAGDAAAAGPAIATPPGSTSTPPSSMPATPPTT